MQQLQQLQQLQQQQMQQQQMQQQQQQQQQQQGGAQPQKKRWKRYGETNPLIGLKSTMLKTSLCRHWDKGHCKYGDTCGFAHGDTELSPSANSEASSSPVCTHAHNRRDHTFSTPPQHPPQQQQQQQQQGNKKGVKFSGPQSGQPLQQAALQQAQLGQQVPGQGPQSLDDPLAMQVLLRR